MVETTRSLQGLIERQGNDEVRVIYVAGNYMLGVPYFKFQVDSTRWHSRSKERRQDYIQKFRNYCPTPTEEVEEIDPAGSSSLKWKMLS